MPNSSTKKIPFLFLILGLLALIAGAAFGTLSGVQYIKAAFLKEIIPFNLMRPLHVSSVIGWIILSATGGIYYYITNVLQLKLYSKKLINAHIIIFTACIVAIYFSFFTGKMGGREYLTYAPIISLPILVGWLFFGVNFFKTVLKQVKEWPVYLWMWGTGIIFMIYHFSEAHFWLIPYFRENFVRDLTVQWKSYGSFVGSWNMLVYGTAIFLMARIKKDESIARGKKVFFFYFLGLTNLMLGWAHHTYLVPSQPWVRYLAYLISMTEWIILIGMLLSWKRMLTAERIKRHHIAYNFLLATDFWIFVNLILALLISIPYINLFTHGTHITVAHSMGTTIGINTSILLASVYYIVHLEAQEIITKYLIIIKTGFWVFYSSFGVFWICLILGGVKKSNWQFLANNNSSFSEMQSSMQPVMMAFLIAGIGILIGLLMVTIPMLIALVKRAKQ